MCEKHLYTYDSATGVEKYTERKLCPNAAYGKTCTRTQEYRHTHGETPAPAHSSRMPPSPPLSDASLHGHSGSDRSYQYINGARVVVSHKSSHRPRRNSTLEVPTTYMPPRTTPPHSPPRPYVVQPAAPPSPTYYERPSRYYPPSPEMVHYEPNEARTRRRSQSHSRHNSDELRRLRRDLEETKEALRQQEKVQSKIAKQNEKIASRPPMTRLPAAPPAPQPVRYRRGSVSIPAHDMRRVHFDTQEAENEAQRERLRARLEPPRPYPY